MNISKDILSEFAFLAASTVYEGAGKSGDMGPEIRPCGDDARIVAPAFTVRCWHGDASACMRAVDEASPGDVLVVDAGSDRSTVWGGAATVAAKYKGLAGVITNGIVRDVAQIRALGFPVFSAGISVRGAVRGHKGWTGIAVSVGGIVVNPGDLVVADTDGVVVIPESLVDATLAAAKKRKLHEEEADRCLASGTKYSEWTGVSATAPLA